MKRRSRARLLFEGLEGIAVVGATLCSWPLSRRWLKNWGATSTEVKVERAGDDLVARASDTHTRAISIEAPAETVWAYLVQFGLERAGFYSYELLERLVGIPVVNIESIEEAWQSLAIGDEVLLHPKAGIEVSRIEPGRHICFGALTGAQAAKNDIVSRSWSLYIEPTSASSCRLLVRTRLGPKAGIVGRLAAALEEPIDFAMEQRMLRSIRRLAEA